MQRILPTWSAFTSLFSRRFLIIVEKFSDQCGFQGILYEHCCRTMNTWKTIGADFVRVLEFIVKISCFSSSPSSLQSYLVGWEEFWKNRWLMAYILTLIVSLTDWVVSLSFFCTEVRTACCFLQKPSTTQLWGEAEEEKLLRDTDQGMCYSWELLTRMRPSSKEVILKCWKNVLFKPIHIFLQVR